MLLRRPIKQDTSSGWAPTAGAPKSPRFSTRRKWPRAPSPSSPNDNPSKVFITGAGLNAWDYFIWYFWQQIQFHPSSLPFRFRSLFHQPDVREQQEEHLVCRVLGEQLPVQAESTRGEERIWHQEMHKWVYTEKKAISQWLSIMNGSPVNTMCVCVLGYR